MIIYNVVKTRQDIDPQVSNSKWNRNVEHLLLNIHSYSFNVKSFVLGKACNLLSVLTRLLMVLVAWDFKARPLIRFLVSLCNTFYIVVKRPFVLMKCQDRHLFHVG